MSQSADATETAEFDLVVVGYGAAGAAAALTAAEGGASVLILEKQAQDAHTPSAKMSGGFIFGVNDVERATAYMHRCAGGMIPLAVTRAWAEKAKTLVEWHDAMGTDLHLERIHGAEQPFDGADAIDVYQQGLLADGRPVQEAMAGIEDFNSPHIRAAGGTDRSLPMFRYGFEYFTALTEAVERRPAIRVAWSSPGRRLVRDGDGRVVGVEHGGDVGGGVVRARHGVVLTCGGYEHDEELKLNYLRAYPIHFYGNPGNTGDGIRMAQDVGASLWHMNQMSGRAIGHFTLDDGRSVDVPVQIAPGGYVIVDKNGRRFGDEYPQAMLEHAFYYHLLSYDADAFDYPRIPCYWVFDQRRLEAGPLIPVGAGAHRVGLYDWSPDNRAEIDRGWIATGATVEEAAAAAGVRDPAATAATVEEYNSYCAAGGGDPFGRPAESLVALDTGPFYCVALYPGGANTSGGPRRNERAEILDAFGEPIPGLYGAGELGQAYGALTPSGGSNLSDANCFGRIAAEAALGLHPDAVLSQGLVAD